jgi:hypothetical protein
MTMGFRFQKRIKLLPGVRINLSKSGVSTSLGVQGAQITKGHGKTRTTVGLPGTGLSHSSVKSNHQQEEGFDNTPEPQYSPAPIQQTHWLVATGKALGTIVGVVAMVAVGIFSALLASGGKSKRRR